MTDLSSNTLSPSEAVLLANSIYFIQNSSTAADFFMQNDTVISASEQKTMQAEVGFRLLNTRDTFGVCARGAGNFEKDVLLVFRGSTSANYAADWVSNARIGLETGISGSKVHLGFNNIFKSMIEQLDAFFKTLGSEKPRTVHCVGHSLGGAVATLAADWAEHHSKANSVKLYTFGAPRPGAESFAKHITNGIGKENMYRVYHESDPVPMIPVFPFCHPPYQNMAYFIHTKPFIWPSDHKMGVYQKSIRSKGKSWSTLSPTAIHEPTEAQIKEWLKSNIKVEPKATSTWRWINSAIWYVLRKILGAAIALFQGAFIVGVTLADSIAITLKKGLDSDGPKGPKPPSGIATAEPLSLSYWTERLIRKIMQIIGWNHIVETAQLTQAFLQQMLQHLINQSNLMATRAVQSMSV